MHLKFRCDTDTVSIADVTMFLTSNCTVFAVHEYSRCYCRQQYSGESNESNGCFSPLHIL